MASGKIDRPVLQPFGSILYSYALASGKTGTLTFPATQGQNTRFVMFTTGPGGTNTGRGLYLAGNVANGTLAYTVGVAASGLTISRSSNELIVNNSSGNDIALLVLMFVGNLPTFTTN